MGKYSPSILVSTAPVVKHNLRLEGDLGGELLLCNHEDLKSNTPYLHKKSDVGLQQWLTS